MSLVKKASAAAVSLLFCLFAALPALAAGQETTVVTTQVPQTHAVDFVINGGGTLIVDGKTVTGSDTLNLPHGKTVTLDFNVKGKTIKQVLLNGEDITGRLSDGRYSVVVMNGMAVSATYDPAPASGGIPNTGGTGVPALLALAAAIALIMMILVYRKKRRAAY